MTKVEKIKAIYKEIANKDKTIWCKYLVYANDEPEKIIEAIEEWINFTLCFENNDYAVIPTEKDYFKYYSIKEIIWHPVMIGDVLNWIDNKMWISNQEYEEFVINEVNMAILLWGEYLKPIDKQSDRCVDFIYSLIEGL